MGEYEECMTEVKEAAQAIKRSVENRELKAQRETLPPVFSGQHRTRDAALSVQGLP